MALGLSLQLPIFLPKNQIPSRRTTSPSLPKIKSLPIFTQPDVNESTISRRKPTQFTVKSTAADEEANTPASGNRNSDASEPQNGSTQQISSANEPQPQSQPTNSNTSDLSELGSEIRKAMKEREGRDGGGSDFWSGVAEEIREIEWPAFGKVLGTTGVVLGVIAGSSVVLLTVNAVLAEVSDRVFGGRGVQDFFS